MHKLFALLFIAMGILATTGCQEDEDPNEATNNRLDGDWEVESWTLDGTEVMNSLVVSFEMEFDKQGPTDGETEWTVIRNNGTTDRTEGDYQVENDGTEIDFDGTDFDIRIDGDELELEGIVNGVRWEIEAERD